MIDHFESELYGLFKIDWDWIHLGVSTKVCWIPSRRDSLTMIRVRGLHKPQYGREESILPT